MNFKDESYLIILPYFGFLNSIDKGLLNHTISPLLALSFNYIKLFILKIFKF